MELFLKNLIFVLVVPGTVGVYIPLLLADGRHIASGPILYLSMVLLVTGAIVCGWCVMDFAIIGRGTPAPIDAPKKLVVRGPYRYVRNPMYMGVLTVLVGWAVMFRWVHLMFY